MGGDTIQKSHTAVTKDLSGFGVSVFARLPHRFLQDDTPWRRCSGLTLLNYNNIIPKQGGNYPALVFAEENRGVVSCFNPSYPDTLFCCRLHPTWSNSF